MDRKKAKVIEEKFDKWILLVEGVEHSQRLFKDKANRSPIGNQIQVGIELDIEIEQTGVNSWKIGRIWLAPESKQRSQHQNQVYAQRDNSKFEFPMAASSEENFYLKLFKQKRLFDNNYDFDGKSFNTKFQKSWFDEDFVAKINENHVKNAENLLGKDQVCSNLIFKPEWRLILGLGGSSVYETGMTLHHIYGIPYLPASAVKGVVRNYAITELYSDEVTALGKKDFCDIFGCSGEGKVDINGEKKDFKSYYKIHQQDNSHNGDRQGKVIFFDVFPQRAIHLEADIMNPHYPEYYGDTIGKVPPADWQNPIPIQFLTIGNKTTFQFIIGVKKKSDISLLNKAELWIKAALKDKGIGAKTAVGYGYFKS